MRKFLNIKRDTSFKRVFGREENKDIIIHFLNDILMNEGEKIIEDVEIISGEYRAPIAFHKASTVDVKCRDKSGKLYIVEMQILPQEGFAQRIEFYASKAYSTQLKEGEAYSELNPVVVIAITDHILFHDTEEYISYHKTLDAKTLKNQFKGMSFVVIELKKFKKKEVEDLENMIEKWCYFMNHSDDAKAALKMVSMGDGIIGRAYEELSSFNWGEAELERYEEELKISRDEKSAVNYGFAKGQIEGEKRAKLKVAQKLLSSGMSPEEVAETTDLSLSDVQSLS